MGYRTVVILNNDVSSDWQHDPELGDKIAHDMNYVSYPIEGRASALSNYGQVIECTHADTQTLMLLDSLRGTPVAHDGWTRHETDLQVQVKMLRAMADKLGYRIVKKPE